MRSQVSVEFDQFQVANLMFNKSNHFGAIFRDFVCLSEWYRYIKENARGMINNRGYRNIWSDCVTKIEPIHYNDIIMCAMASQLNGLTIVNSAVYSGTDQCKHQSSAPLAFVHEIHRWPVDSPHKGPITRKIFPFDDVIMWWLHFVVARRTPKTVTTTFGIFLVILWCFLR